MSTTWHLRKPDGATYGPVALDTLGQWAADGRVTPEDQVSPDGQTWQPAPGLRELGMDWIVQLASGEILGPVNLLALREPWQCGQIAHRTTVVRRSNGHTHDAADALATGLLAALEQEQQRAEALADQVRTLTESAASAQRGQQAAEARLALEIQSGKARLEELSDLHRKALADAQAANQNLCAERDDARQRAEQASAELRDAAARTADLESRLQAAETAPQPAQTAPPPGAAAPAPDQPAPPLPFEGSRATDLLEREVQRWKRLYESEDVRARKTQDELEAQVSGLREELLEARRLAERAQVRAREEETRAGSAPAGGEPGKLDNAALNDMIRRLSRNYSTMSDQAERTADELAKAQARIAQLEAQLQADETGQKLAAAQAELVSARQRQDELETTHRDILRQFRDLNDRHLRLMQARANGTP